MEPPNPGALDAGMDRLGVPAAAPTHIQHVASQYSMELLSDDCYQQESDLEGDLKSRGSSGIGSGLDTPPLLASGEWQYHSKSPGGRVGGEEDFDGTMPELCSVNLQDYINDFDEFLPHDEAMRGGGDPVKVSVYDHQQPESTDEGCMGEDVCMSTYERWKKLSGPMLIFIVILLVVLVWGRGHLIDLLEWLEHLPLYESTPVFIVLFTFVSFPFGFGNLILNLTAGYLYGFVYGQLIVMVSVAVGLSVAFELCRRWFRGYARSITTSKALQAVLRVVEGPHGFKVIFLTRFTPIPFGLQNVVFSVTKISFWRYSIASVLGLLPIQLLSSYMGSTLRNMQEVLTDRVDGYIILGVQVVISTVLMVFLYNKAQRELAKITHTRDERGTP